MFLFTSQPLILGFAGIANHDMAATAGVALSLYAFVLWLDRADWKRAVFLGVAYGLSIAWKFSDLAFVPVACLAVYAVRFGFRDDKSTALKRAFAAVPIVVIAAMITVWATYSFAFGSLDDYGIEQGPGAKLASERFGRNTAMPAPHLIAGGERALLKSIVGA